MHVNAPHHPFDLLLRAESRLRKLRAGDVLRGNQQWSVLSFRLGPYWLVAPREEIREIVPPPVATRVPNAHAWLQGLANIRSELLVIVDLAPLAGLAPSRPGRTQRALVVETENGSFALLVDEVGGQRQLAPGEQRHELIRTMELPAGLRRQLLGVFVRDAQSYLALSLRKMMSAESMVGAA